MTDLQQTILIESTSIYEALLEGTKRFDLDLSQLSYEVDRDHFRTEKGKSVGRDTIKVLVFCKSAEESKHETKPTSKKINSQVQIESEAGSWGAVFLQELIEKMGISATVSYVIKDSSKENIITLLVKSDQGGRLVGRKGSSLRKIKYILDLVKYKVHPDYEFYIDILSEGQQRDNFKKQSDEKYKKSEYKKSEKKARLSEREIEKMKKMATKVGIKVREDKKAVVITKVLNNFERKIIHEVISNMEDIGTESFNDPEGVRRIRIYPILETAKVDVVSEKNTETSKNTDTTTSDSDE